MPFAEHSNQMSENRYGSRSLNFYAGTQKAGAIEFDWTRNGVMTGALNGRNNNEVAIFGIKVSEGYPRHVIARQMIEAVKQLAVENNFEIVTLQADRAENMTALYKGCGFERSEYDRSVFCLPIMAPGAHEEPEDELSM